MHNAFAILVQPQFICLLVANTSSVSIHRSEPRYQKMNRLSLERTDTVNFLDKDEKRCLHNDDGALRSLIRPKFTPKVKALFSGVHHQSPKCEKAFISPHPPASSSLLSASPPAVPRTRKTWLYFVRNGLTFCWKASLVLDLQAILLSVSTRTNWKRWIKSELLLLCHTAPKT